MLDGNPHVWLWSMAGLVIGGLVAGLLVRARIKALLEPRLARWEAQNNLLNEQLRDQSAANADLTDRLKAAEETARNSRNAVNELNIALASRDAQLQRIPALETETAEVRKTVDELQATLRQESAALARAMEKGRLLEKLEDEKFRQEERFTELQGQAARYQAQIAELGVLLEEERKQATEKITLLNQAREQLKVEFQNLAQKIFDDKSSQFVEQNRTHIDGLISPLREQIVDFKKRVEDVYDKETRDRTALQTEIHQLKELNQRISKEALNLTRALKGDSKARGNWGEVVLERVLEASGLQKGREYEVQISLKGDDGKRYQPDVIVRLPQGKDVVVDAKVSLKDYEAYYSAEDADRREAHLRAHVESLRNHVRSLAAKSYEGLEGVRSLDFVLMFVPIESAFLAAVERDRELFAEAFAKNIMVVSPSTLLVTLRTIENIWRHEYQNRYALEIARKAGAMHDKFVLFVESLEEIGQQLDRARESHRLALDRLASGRGNLIRRTLELKKLGVKAGKEISAAMIEMADPEEEAE